MYGGYLLSPLYPLLVACNYEKNLVSYLTCFCFFFFNENNFVLYSCQENSCFINGYCFAANESNPIDLCYQCLPNVSANTWTKRLGNYSYLSVCVILLDKDVSPRGLKSHFS